MFKITEGRGFHITFANGYTISVQFGIGNYCTNRHDRNAQLQQADCNLQCENAEVAAYAQNGNWYRPTCLNSGDDVAGYVTPDQLAQVIAEVQALPTP